MGVAKENFILKMVQTQRSCSVCICSSCGQLFTAGSRTASRSELAQTARDKLLPTLETSLQYLVFLWKL